MVRNSTGFLCFPFSNFRYSLTLFSKFFASFPHGTCTLSVSHRYLALDGIYHPLWAAIPSNSTRRRHLPWAHIPSKNGSLTLSAAPFQETWLGTSPDNASIDHNSTQDKACVDSHDELNPLHSPLLGVSLLVSFPPLIYMLKFGG